ncbi:hypothetical protein IMSAGC004_02218 [Bacteroidaceae bacterium]|nr:hypothetical protein IMSAGC004_02218 [Bacteroidaceae bacterium]
MVKPLSGEEHVQVSGGYAPPTAEQMGIYISVGII